MTAKFCGNPRNHDAHEFEYAVDADHGMVPLMAWCDGVGVEAFEKTVEKYDPTLQAMDGTPYSKITILMEDQDGNVTIISAPKSSFVELDIQHQQYVSLDMDIQKWSPDIEKAVFTFKPHQIGNDPAFTVERVKHDANNSTPPGF